MTNTAQKLHSHISPRTAIQDGDIVWYGIDSRIKASIEASVGCIDFSLSIYTQGGEFVESWGKFDTYESAVVAMHTRLR